MADLKKLAEIGQSIWLDDIRRSYLESGRLGEWINDGIRGVTSNPTIFKKAIADSDEYDRDVIGARGDVFEVYERLVIDDIGRAADLFLPVFRDTGGIDGYVSLEVSPMLAHDCDATVAEAERLFKTLARPNVMIKVPATAEGIPAIRELISRGVNINVTLIFGTQHYNAVADAYLSGLERLSGRGGDPEKTASVASIFVSRTDTAVDRLLEERDALSLKGGTSLKDGTSLRGQIAVANAKMCYSAFSGLFSGGRWEALAAKGARPQRVLWASTGTKNPGYSDTLYVDNLIGPQTVNTLPPATLAAWLDHGSMRPSVTLGLDEARASLEQLEPLGIDLNAVTDELQDDGVTSFATSFEQLLEAIANKMEKSR